MTVEVSASEDLVDLARDGFDAGIRRGHFKAEDTTRLRGGAGAPGRRRRVERPAPRQENQFDDNQIVEEIEVIKGLAAMAHPLRLKIFRALVVVGPPGLTPGAILDALRMPPATLSFHLKELVHAGLITQERASRHLIYRARYDRMNALLGYLTENCCRGEACAFESGSASCAC